MEFKNINSANIFPISMTQRQFWLIHQFHPDTSAYNIRLGFRIKGKLDVQALQESLNKIVQRHEIFRTTFHLIEGNIIQIVKEKVNLNISENNLSDQPEAETRIKAFVHEEAIKSFELDKGPLLRIKLFRISDNENILLIVIHHIIFDLYTKDLFSSELMCLYNSYVDKTANILEEPVYQYRDYIAWQEEWFKESKFMDMLSFWKNNLYGNHDLLDFPYDKPRPAEQSLNGSDLPLQFTSTLTKNLKQFSKKEKVNAYLILLTAYLILLYRYSRQSNITIGVPLTNRRNDMHKKIMGCFVHILPLSFQLTDKMTFKEILQQVRNTMLQAHRNQEVPYESILNASGITRDISYNPLFQFGFTFEDPMRLELNGLEITSLRIPRAASQLDMFFILWEDKDKFDGLIEYNTDLFEESKITKIANNYFELLNSIIENPDESISLIKILTGNERAQLLLDWNNTAKNYPDSTTIQKLFEKQVEITPDKIAIVCEDKNLTYSELNDRANQLAHYIASKGILPQTLIGISIERSVEMIIGLLGILKAGCAFVPIDPDYPSERISYMLDHSRIPILISQQGLDINIPDKKIESIFIDRDWNEISKKSSYNPDIKTGPETTAYVIYTSGSTGKPKGVVIPHSALINFLFSMKEEPGLNSEDIVIALTTLSFDISLLEIFLPIIFGAKTVLISRIAALDGDLLIKKLDEEKITFMQATPATWRILLSSGWEGSASLKVLCGGEPLPHDLLQELLKRVTSVWNMYGPTETTIWSTLYHLKGPDDPILIGRPIANTSIYILDDKMNLVPTGVPGELYIGGSGLAKGYLHQPEMTQDRFIKNPFNDDQNSRIYKTGDNCRYLSDGNIEFIGRADNQVKVQGFRIELGEIEFALSKHPQVQKSVLAVRQDSFGNNRLAAYVIPKDKVKPKINSIKEFLSQTLPKYMIPDTYTFIEEFPLTLNGKIDRKKLPEPARERPDIGSSYIPATTEFEIKLSDIWCKCLGISRVGINDNFFDLGGNSILSVQLASLIQKNFNLTVPVAKIFQYTTISTLSEYLGKGKDTDLPLNKIQDRARKQKRSIKQHRKK